MTASPWAISRAAEGQDPAQLDAARDWAEDHIEGLSYVVTFIDWAAFAAWLAADGVIAEDS